MKTRLEMFEEEVYRFVFELLDAEPDMGGMDSGAIATRTAQYFVEVYKIQESLEVPK